MAVTRDISVRVRVVGDKEYRAAMKRISSATKTFAGWTDTTIGMLASDAIKKGFAAIVSGIEKSINASIDFESALADVAKVTTMNATEIEYFGKRMQELSTEIPITANELLGLAEIAGQLGVADGDIEEFTKVMAALGVTTNLSSEQAAESIAKLANIMGTEAGEFEKIGSVIVELGNNGASTEEEIANMASRIAGVGSLIGASEADILAISSALASLGIEADAGGGTISKWMTEMATDVLTGTARLEDFAKVAGVSANEFRQAWMSDPTQAFNAWIQGLAQMEAEGQSALLTLGEFGVKEIRMRRVLASLVTGNEVLDESLEMANRAWEENIALQQEAEVRYGTSASKLSMFSNQLDRLKVAVGDGLKPATMQTVANLQEIAEAATKAVEGTDSLPEMIADIDQAYKTQGRSIEIAEAQADELINAMEKLGDVGKLDSTGMEQYYALLAQLKIVAPDAAALINSTTGAIEGGYEALRNAAQEWAQNERLALEVAKAEEQISALEVAEKRMAATQAQLAAAQGEYNVLLADMEELRRAMETGETTLQGPEIEDQYNYLSGELGNYESTIERLNWQLTTQQREIDEYGKSIENTFVNISEASGVAVEGMSAAESAMLGNFQLLEAQANALYESYLEAELAARETIDSLISGYEKIEIPEPASITDMIGGLDSQIAYMNEYMALLEKAQTMGIGGDTLAGLADGSAESYAMLQAIVNDGGVSLEELETKQAEVERLKGEMAAAMATAQTDFETKATAIETAMNGMVDTVNQQPAAYANAAATIQGIIDGFNSKIATLSAVVNRVQSLSRAASGASYTGTWTGAGTAGYTPHAAGLSYVPYDNYPAMLHRGEMVLTALEARAYRAEQYANYGMMAALNRDRSEVSNTANNQRYSSQTDNSTNFGDVYVNGERDVRKLVAGINNLKKRQARGRGLR